MKPFGLKISSFEISGGIKIPAIILGEKGRGRKISPIPVDSKLIPEQGYYIKDQLVEVGLTRSGNPKIIPSNNSTGWLARISSLTSYIRGGVGTIYVEECPRSVEILGERRNQWEPRPGVDGVELISIGKGAFGDAGRVGNWEEVLIKMTDNSWVMVEPTRGRNFYIYFSEKEAFELDSFESASLLVDNNESIKQLPLHWSYIVGVDMYNHDMTMDIIEKKKQLMY